MQNELNQLVEAAEQAIIKAADLKSLDDIRVQYLGKKGSITEQMKSLGKLPKEEKPAAGQAINVAKQAIQKAIEADKRNGMKWNLARDYALYADLFKRKGDLPKAKEN